MLDSGIQVQTLKTWPAENIGLVTAMRYSQAVRGVFRVPRVALRKVSLVRWEVVRWEVVRWEVV